MPLDEKNSTEILSTYSQRLQQSLTSDNKMSIVKNKD